MMQCRPCRKEIRTEAEARRVALELRTQVVRASRIRKGYDRTHAYECPAGNGWHVGRARRRDWPPRWPHA